MQTFILVFFAIVAVILLALLIKYWKQLGEYIADVRTEMTKVAWPSQTDVTNAVVLVFVIAIALTLATGIVDAIIGKGMGAIFKIFS